MLSGTARKGKSYMKVLKKKKKKSIRVGGYLGGKSLASRILKTHLMSKNN